ncbi:peptide/nickel transport system substrate-binding protein [Paenibacillus sp. yr247]|uniref:ABC transporter substrate-binding protein n=1 Tax=Paenibacillus sp. yr247 TaxID=1761880 RepID=UPI000882929D|nr:ABC transporter substrate-binding protein [Paenibacillus sp. yr247]SDM78922.1 peptide/nickel transport system substrate-binding protein [Paenibacillus sp. yr247]
MRKSTLFTSTLIALALITSACGKQDATPQTSPAGSPGASATAQSGKPKDGGNLVIAVTADPEAMNPIYAGDRVTLTIDQALYAPLFQINDGKKTFYLADSLTASPDFLTYTLKLKNNLTWHDGQKLTADDVVFTIDKILEEKQHSFLRSSFVIGDKPVQVKKVDDTTVEFKLPQVTAAFEGALVQVFPIPKHIFENEMDIQKSDKNNKPVGSGPFKFKEYKQGEYVTLERFDGYFGGKPHLDSVIYRVAKDPNASNLALQNGEINLKLIDPQDFKKINDTGKFTTIPYFEGRLAYMVFNLNVDALKKKEVRQAIAYALDKKQIIEASYTSLDFADPAASILTPDTLFQAKDINPYNTDVNKAKELLKAAGADKLKLRLAYVNSNKAQTSQALYVQQKLKEVGVEVELQPLDSAAFSKKALNKDNKDFDISFGGYIMGFEPDAYKSLYMSTEQYNYSHYSNKDFDLLWNQAAIETDKSKRAELYKKIQQVVADEMTVYPIAYTKSIIAIDKKYDGLKEAVTKPVVMFEDLSKIYVK